MNTDSTTPAPLETPLRCFIVEDNALILRNLTETLQEMVSLQVTGNAPDSPSACQWLNQHADSIDLMIVDIFLQRGSGLDVLQHARGMDLKAPRVVLTNYATPDIRKRCADLGAHRVFDKSSELDELIAYCQELQGTD